MTDRVSSAYPRRRVQRGLMRLLGRLIVPLFFRIRVSGREHFLRRGPLLVVGNHVAAMEAVLMVVYTPWQVELLGSVDVPHEKVTQIAFDIWRPIAFKRGHFSRAALMQALQVLKQGGVLGLFPEGGIWDTGRMRAQTGVAWLSHQAQAPVLPIAFGGTRGALGAAMRLERPRLTMTVGELIPPAQVSAGQRRKAVLQEYAKQVVEEIRALLPDDDTARPLSVLDERFELEVALKREDGTPIPCPDHLVIQHAAALAQVLHNPAILKIFTSNLHLPAEPLQNLHNVSDPAIIATAVQAILNYLDAENPYLLTYRFGPRQAQSQRRGLEELLALAEWAARADFRLLLTPIRRYTSPDTGEEVVQVQQRTFEGWM